MQEAPMSRRLAVLVFLGGWAIAACQTQPAHQGTLEPALVPSNRGLMLRTQVATDEQIADLDVPVPDGAQILVADGRRPGGARGEDMQIVLVKPSDGAPAVYVDANLDGMLETPERFELSPSDHPRYTHAVIVQFPLPNDPFPVRFTIPGGDLVPAGVEQQFLIQSAAAKVVGRIEIDGRTTQVELPYDMETGSIPLTNGHFAVDGNGDGVIPEDYLSPERAIAEAEQVVFRLGSRYVSFESADRTSGVFALREHPRTDYTRIELVVGQELTDFEFHDFEGRKRRLSDFRGQFLLLDFWGTWCGPCVREIPNLKAAYAQFRERGFEILGIDHGDEFEQARAFVAEREMDWPEVHPESGDPLVQERFRIIGYPTYVLLDPTGTILSVGREGQPPLRGEALLETLEQVLPPSQALAAPVAADPLGVPTRTGPRGATRRSEPSDG